MDYSIYTDSQKSLATVITINQRFYSIPYKNWQKSTENGNFYGQLRGIIYGEIYHGRDRGTIEPQ